MTSRHVSKNIKLTSRKETSDELKEKLKRSSDESKEKSKRSPLVTESKHKINLDPVETKTRISEETDEDKTLTAVLIGGMSSGKSTILNTIYSNLISDMNRGQTTIGVNNYCETQQSTMTAEEIYTKNKQNEDIKNIPDKIEKLQENSYPINISPNFGNTAMRSGYLLKIVDVPGLNSTNNNVSELTEKWIDANFKNFDIVIFVMDFNYAINTAPIMKLFERLIINIKKSNNVFLLNVINKYDRPQDKEEQRYKQEIENMIDERLKNTDIQYKTVSMCANKAFAYRVAENTSLKNLPDAYRDELLTCEFGANGSKMSETEVNLKLVEHINQSKKDGVYYKTNYHAFINSFEIAINTANNLRVKKLTNSILFATANNTEDLVKLLQKFIKLAKLEQNNKSSDDLNNKFITEVNKFLDNACNTVDPASSIREIADIINTYFPIIVHHYANIREKLIEVYKKIVNKPTSRFSIISHMIVEKLKLTYWIDDQAIIEILKEYYAYHFTEEGSKNLIEIRIDEDETTILMHPNDHLQYFLKNSKIDIHSLIDYHLVFLNKMNNTNRIKYYIKEEEQLFKKYFNIAILEFIESIKDGSYSRFRMCKYTLSNKQIEINDIAYVLTDKRVSLIQNLLPKLHL